MFCCKAFTIHKAAWESPLCLVIEERYGILLKEVIQPQVPLRLPCYDFTPIIGPTVDDCLWKVSSSASGKTNFRGVTGGVYKARERIHPGMLIQNY